ncbi:MAG: family 10 glycosylhydrolase [Bacteroidota bacterium]
MKHLIIILILYLVLTPLDKVAQSSRETRAVWISTNYRLDWPPPTFDEEEQKKSLLEIFDDIESKNLNTIYLQVRSNGTTLFQSSFEPFSPYITGKVDEFGSYDPLEFAVNEAHKRGLEIHAWINTMRCFNTSDISILENEKHVSTKYPHWVYKKDEENGSISLWLNPGIPEVRQYLIDVIDELVLDYEIDGVQLDFVRYPQEPIHDTESYSVYGNGKDINDWRRENINTFIDELSKKIKTSNPMIKLGVTPIGIYKNISNARGLQGYYDVYQDSREWLSKGYIDYAVPQIYWDINNNPRFPDLVEDWISNSYDRNVIIGIAAYRQSIVDELSEEINITRLKNANGTAFFRYSNIKDIDISEYDEKVLPPKMDWIMRTDSLPGINAKISLDENHSNKLSIEWELNSSIYKNVKYLSLYQLDDPTKKNYMKLLKVLPSNLTSTSISISDHDKVNYSYTVKSVDQLWNESNNWEVLNYEVPKLKNIEDKISKFNKPLLSKIGKQYFLIINSNQIDQLKIVVEDNEGQQNQIDLRDISLGMNMLEVNSDIIEYDKISLMFTNSGRTVELRK